MAYGTTNVTAVDKIFGPGNAYVCEAKRQVFGTVGVDSLPGPSEVMIVADESARADYVAADLLAQAEHGSGREKVYLVATSQAFIDEVATEVQAQLKLITRSEKTQAVLTHGFAAIEVSTLAQIVEIANYVAPEHLELMVKEASVKKLTQEITTAGSILVGQNTDCAWRFHRRSQPRAAHGPHRPLLQRTPRHRFHAPHQHREIRPRQREKRQRGRRRLRRHGETRRPRPLGGAARALKLRCAS